MSVKVKRRLSGKACFTAVQSPTARTWEVYLHARYVPILLQKSVANRREAQFRCGDAILGEVDP